MLGGKAPGARWKRRCDFGFSFRVWHRTIIAAANGGFRVAELFLHQSKMKIGCAKFLHVKYNRRITVAGVNESLARIETLRRKFRRVA